MRVELVNHHQVVGHGVAGVGDAQFLPNLRTFTRQADERVAHLTLVLHLAHRHVVIGTRAGHGRDERPFDERIPVDVVRHVHFDTTLAEFTGNPLQPFWSHLLLRTRTEHQAEDATHLADFPFARHEAYDVDTPVEHLDRRHQAADAGPRAIHIQDRDDQGVGGSRTLQHGADGVNGIAFHAHQDDIRLSLVFFGGACLYAEEMLPLQVRLQVQPLSADSFQVLSAGNAGHVLACQCQKAGDASSYTARSDDEIIHGEKSYKEKQARSVQARA